MRQGEGGKYMCIAGVETAGLDLRRVQGLVACNAFEISDRSSGAGSSGAGRTSGSGLFAVPSLFNHACAPNCDWVQHHRYSRTRSCSSRTTRRSPSTCSRPRKTEGRSAGGLSARAVSACGSRGVPGSATRHATSSHSSSRQTTPAPLRGHPSNRPRNPGGHPCNCSRKRCARSPRPSRSRTRGGAWGGRPSRSPPPRVHQDLPPLGAGLASPGHMPRRLPDPPPPLPLPSERRRRCGRARARGASATVHHLRWELRSRRLRFVGKGRAGGGGEGRFDARGRHVPRGNLRSQEPRGAAV
ncbi:hypothetical protein T484DRAFT_1926490, partial [Baffinella frigidus]